MEPGALAAFATGAEEHGALTPARQTTGLWACQPPEQLRLGYVMSLLYSLYSTAAPQGRRTLQDTGRGLVSEGGATSGELCGVVTQSAPSDEETRSRR